MTDKYSGSVDRWPTFADRQNIIGCNVLDFVDWVVASKRVLADRVDPGLMPIIALPPVQRSAVWRPKQVLDLWDSLMRGLPIGTFYLVSQPARHRDVVLPGTNETARTSAEGFDLLDGQQRVRTLMVGINGPADEKRCLWIDLGAETAEQGPCLRLTSKAQPFGYNPETGDKLHLDQRRRAREQIEPDGHPLQHVDGTGDLRRAYDLELFEDEVTQDGKRLRHQPPLPYGASEGSVFQLHKLLAVWRECAPRNAEEGVTVLRGVTGSSPELERPLIALHEAFNNVEKAQIALLRVDPGDFRGGSQDLLALFERIGAGGTPLSGEERLYSIYKHYVPKIRDTVEEIHQEAGRVLSPTKIVAAALRIANARADEHRNNTPDSVEFTKAMTATPESMLRQNLGQLLPVASAISGSPDGLLSKSFVTVKSLLSYKDGVESFWLPDVMLAMLPAELWQVLVFWATNRTEPVDQELYRQEVVRFALFWRLCVWNDEKAASTAFAYIKDKQAKHENFPGVLLYRQLIGVTEGEPYAHALLPPDEFERKLCKGESPAWRTDEDRFVENKLRNDIGSHWWWHGRRMLPWLQRNYIRDAFPGYVPLSEHEDDLPYDVDHICPYNDWGYWWSVKNRVESDLQQRMRDGRGAIGNGIGNLRIIDSSINKRDQDADISEKMPFITADNVSDADRLAMDSSAFPPEPEHRAVWKRVSRPGPIKDRKWNPDRLAAFQRAVEQRTAWLYRCFYDDLNYGSWMSTPGDSG